MTVLRAQFRSVSLLILVATVASVWFLARRGYRIDDLQTVMFPLVLLSFWRLPRDRRFSAPVPVLLGALTVWGISALHVRGFLPNPLLPEGVYLARLDDDPTGLIARQFLWNYKQRANAAEYPPLKIIERRMEPKRRAETWLAKNPHGLMMLGGDAQWLNATLPNAARVFGPDQAEADPGVVELLRSYGWEAGREVVVVHPAGFPTPLVLIATPESIAIPVTPMGLASELVAWLSEGLQREVKDEAAMESRRADFLEAASIDGPWKTNAPRGAAQFIAGNIDLYRALQSATPTAPLLDCATGNYFQATLRIQKRYASDIVAAILNNQAILSLVDSHKREEIREARQSLTRAIRFSVDEPRPTRGGQAALINWILLERAGVF